MSRTVADLLVECLEKEGVHYVFGVPGEEIEDLLFALVESIGSRQLRLIEVRLDSSVNLGLVEKLKRHWQRASGALPQTREMS